MILKSVLNISNEEHINVSSEDHSLTGLSEKLNVGIIFTKVDHNKVVDKKTYGSATDTIKMGVNSENGQFVCFS